MDNSTSLYSSGTSLPIRLSRCPRAGIGSASCKHGSFPVIMRWPSTRHRRRAGCRGHRRSCSRRQNTSSMPRCPTPHAGIGVDRPAPAAPSGHAAHHEQLEVWAKNCPDNFRDHAALVGAEIARIEGRDVDAMRLYDQAIRSAGQAALFTTRRSPMKRLHGTTRGGVREIANTYLRDARYCYIRWGADGKVRQLDEMYPHLKEPDPALVPADCDRDFGRASRSRDRDQGVASSLWRDRARKAARGVDAHRDRAQAGAERLAHLFRR